MNRNQIVVYIDANRDEYSTKPNFDSLRDIIQEDEWVDDLKTFSFKIHSDPSFTLVNNQFCFETNRECIGDNCISFKKFLTDEQIQTLNYWEYEGEKIYSSKIIDRWDVDWIISKSHDIWLVSKELIEYLNNNPLQEFHDETIEELSILNRVSEFCKDYEYEMIFVDSYLY
jgi:hypothetical protein